jgi:hypothetical protein
MTIQSISILSQIVQSKLDSDTPRVEAGSTVVTWVIAGILVVAVLLIAFKTARRNNQLLDD